MRQTQTKSKSNSLILHAQTHLIVDNGSSVKNQQGLGEQKWSELKEHLQGKLGRMPKISRGRLKINRGKDSLFGEVNLVSKN